MNQSWIFILIIACCEVLFITSLNADSSKATFELFSGEQHGSVTSISHKSFHQCSLDKDCNFVARDVKSNSYKRYSLECQLPKSRKNLVIFKKGKNIPESFKSCKDIKEHDQSYPSGKYQINAKRIGEEYITVYCDMTTDGGGWTQVLYVTSDTDDYNVFKSKPLGKISTLTGFTASGNYGMTTSALADLRKITRFQQLRFRCKTKAHTNRLINIKTVMNPFGAAVVEYFCSTTAANPASCRSYEAYDDDDSWLSRECLSWWRGQWNSLHKNEKLFNHPIVKAGALHWNILTEEDRFECDDPERAHAIGNGDIWEVYAR